MPSGGKGEGGWSIGKKGGERESLDVSWCRLLTAVGCCRVVECGGDKVSGEVGPQYVRNVDRVESTRSRTAD